MARLGRVQEPEQVQEGMQEQEACVDPALGCNRVCTEPMLKEEGTSGGLKAALSTDWQSTGAAMLEQGVLAQEMEQG